METYFSIIIAPHIKNWDKNIARSEIINCPSFILLVLGCLSLRARDSSQRYNYIIYNPSKAHYTQPPCILVLYVGTRLAD